MHFFMDNFFEDIDQERENALNATYSTMNDFGAAYPGMSIQDDGASVDKIMKLANLKQKVKSVFCFYRRYMDSDGVQPTFIHSDYSVGNITAVVCLTPSEKCHGGSAFWKHRALGLETFPDSEYLSRAGIKDENTRLLDLINEDGLIEDRWELTDYVPLTTNRCVVFDSPNYHSRYPQDNIGKDMSDCRLIKTFFIKTE